MKELSIEDKAKRYDEAIEIAKKINNERQAQPFDVMTRVFPELAESKDEKIRKEILSFLREGQPYYSPCSTKRQEWADWLEKQGKNNTGISEATKKELEDNLNRALEKETPESCNDFLEKQGKQKPAIKLERDDNGEAVLTPFEAELFSMMSEAWQGYSFGEEVNIAKIVKEHSKELLERANEQKPTWNEEDEYYLAGVIETELYMLDVVNGVKKFDVGNESIKEECTRELNWLTFFKERNTWRPSDEQMQALCSKLPLLTGSGNEVQRVLETLYCDLKKLRNE